MRKLLVAFALGIVVSCSSSPDSGGPVLSGQDSQVIAAALEATTGWPPQPVFRASLPLGAYSHMLRQLTADQLPPEILDDLLARNRRSRPLFPSDPARFPVSKDALVQGRYVLRASLPGYASDGQRAAVYLGAGCGPACSRAALVLMERDGQEWKLGEVIRLTHH